MKMDQQNYLFLFILFKYDLILVLFIFYNNYICIIFIIIKATFLYLGKLLFQFYRKFEDFLMLEFCCYQQHPPLFPPQQQQINNIKMIIQQQSSPNPNPPHPLFSGIVQTSFRKRFICFLLLFLCIIYDMVDFDFWLQCFCFLLRI